MNLVLTEMGWDMTHTNNSRVYFLDYVKALIIVLIVAHHSSLAYSLAEGSHQNFIYSTAQILDSKKLFIFDYFENFNDIYFMPLIFLISGFFSYDSLVKHGACKYVEKRFMRLMVPFLFSMVILMPLSYYPVNLLQDNNLGLFDYISKDYIFNFYHIPGPIWFLLALFVFDSIIALFYKVAPNKFSAMIESVQQAGRLNFVLTFISATIIIYFLSYIFIPADSTDKMAKLGPIWFQKKRIVVYFAFFLFGLFGGAAPKFRDMIIRDNKRFTDTWLFKIVLGVMLFGLLRYLQTSMLHNQGDDLLLDFVYCTLFVFIALIFSSAWIATVAKFFNRRSRSMKSLSDQAYGIFIFHFIIVVWLQYMLYTVDLAASEKFYIVFSFSLSLSWVVTMVLRKIPAIRSVL